MTVSVLNSGIVPTRFLCITAHLVVLITILINRKEHVDQCEITTSKTFKDYENEFIIALSLSIVLTIIELTSFTCGITLLNSFQSFLSTIFHSSAAIALSYLLIDLQCSVYIWPIFAICSCLPFSLELVYLFGVWLFKRPIS